jgi:hypothetical protein
MSKSTSTPSKSQKILYFEIVIGVSSVDVVAAVAVDEARKNPSSCLCFLLSDDGELLPLFMLDVQMLFWMNATVCLDETTAEERMIVDARLMIMRL